MLARSRLVSVRTAERDCPVERREEDLSFLLKVPMVLMRLAERSCTCSTRVRSVSPVGEEEVMVPMTMINKARTPTPMRTLRSGPLMRFFLGVVEFG